MWTWLSRLFRSSSAAERAEAEGRIEDAARLYVDKGDRAEAVRVYLRAAETARTLEDRREYYTRAYGLGRSEDLRDAARKGLAMVTLAEAEAAAPRSDEDRRRLQEAAEDLERLGSWRDAGRAYALLEDREAVVRVLTLAGDVDALERVTGTRDEADRKGLRRRGALEGFDALWRSGDRVKALRDLGAWVAANSDDHEARGAYDARSAMVLRDGRCELEVDGQRVLVVGRFPVSLGREADVVLRGASVSRRHCSLEVSDGAFVLRDGGSRAGTTLEGVPIAAPLRLAAEALVGLGSDLALRVHAGADATQLTLEVERGMDRGRRITLVARRYALPVGAMRFEAEGPVVSPSAPVSLNGQKVALEFTLVRGDRVEVPGHTLTVL
jgi:hypothetical protein